LHTLSSQDRPLPNVGVGSVKPTHTSCPAI